MLCYLMKWIFMLIYCPKCNNIGSDTFSACKMCGFPFASSSPQSTTSATKVTPNIVTASSKSLEKQTNSAFQEEILPKILLIFKKIFYFFIGEPQEYQGKVIAVSEVRHIQKANISYPLWQKIFCVFFSIMFNIFFWTFSIIFSMISISFLNKSSGNFTDIWDKHNQNRARNREMQIPVFDFRIITFEGKEKSFTLIGDCEMSYPSIGDDVVVIGRRYGSIFKIKNLTNKTLGFSLKIRL